MKPGSQQKITKAGQKRFEKWNANKTPVFNSEGEELILKDDEYFTMLCDYYNSRKGTNRETLFNPRYYISNYGNIISFTELNKDTPKWLLRKGNQGKITDYEKCGGWYVHVAIYFSFVLATEEQRDYLSRQKIQLRKYNGKYQVHHIDRDHWHNYLGNLQGLTTEIHDALTTIGDRHVGIEKFKSDKNYVKNVLRKINANELEIEDGKSIVIPDSKETAVIQTEVLLSDYSKEQSLLMEYGLTAHEKVKEAVEMIGIQNFEEDQIIALQFDGEEMPLSFNVKKTDDTHVHIQFISNEEIEDKEVYVYSCAGQKNTINKKLYVRLKDGSNAFVVQKGMG